MNAVRAVIDQVMGTGAATALVLVHAVALLCATVWRKGMAPVLIVNLLTSAAILAYNAGNLGAMIEYGDAAPLMLTAYAAAAFIVSVCALFGMRIANWIGWAVFAIDLGFSTLLLTYLVFFRMTRLF